MINSRDITERKMKSLRRSFSLEFLTTFRTDSTRYWATTA